MQANTQQRLYSLHQAEAALGVSRSTLYRLMERGQLRTVKIGDRRLIPLVELERLCGDTETNDSDTKFHRPSLRNCEGIGETK